MAAVQEALVPPLAYTTVQTMLNILHRKGKLTRALSGRAYVYTAAVTESRAVFREVRDLIDRMFGGSTEALVLSLVQENQLDAKKLAKLAAKLEKKGRQAMNALAVGVAAYVINALWQVPLLAAASWLAAWLLRRLGSVRTHRVWVAALLAQTVLPACATPAWLRGLRWGGQCPRQAEMRPLPFGSGSAAGVPPWSASALHLGLLAYVVLTTWLLLRLLWRLRGVHRLRQTAQPARPAASAAALDGNTARMPAFAPCHVRSPQPFPVPSCWAGADLCCSSLAEIAATLDVPELAVLLAHEAAHVERRDYPKNLLYEIATLPVACHPALWWTRAHMRQSREMACDALAAARVGGEDKFAANLLRLAVLLAGTGTATVSHAIGIFDAQHAGTEDRNVAGTKNESTEKTPVGKAGVVCGSGVCNVPFSRGAPCAGRPTSWLRNCSPCVAGENVGTGTQ